jgi:transcription elongation factor Elf1
MSFDPDADHRRQAAKELVRHGREALKAGERERARQLLLEAADYDRDNSDAWLWLSATTDDPAQQKQYLERAVAADPGNAAARQGLGIVTGQIKVEDLAAPGQEPVPVRTAEPVPVTVTKTFTCPRCGGRLRFDPEQQNLRCDSCGQAQPVQATPAAGPEQVLDFSLPTRQAQRWAEAERLFTCQQCGAGTLLPHGQTSSTCPFCGASALVAASEETELIPPHAIIPLRLLPPAIANLVRIWLGRDFFAPDDLSGLARDRRLAAVYVPFWCFSMTMTAYWRAQVAQRGGRSWNWIDGDTTFFYTSFLQPGSRALPTNLLRAVGPFDLEHLVRYQPDFLAGWPAGTYDISLAQASLDARAAIVQDVTKKLWTKAVPGRAVSDLHIVRPEFSGQTFQLVLLPVYVGTYTYRARTFHVLVNGQSGKVAGDRPADSVKVVLMILLLLATIVPIGIGVFLWLRQLLAR